MIEHIGEVLLYLRNQMNMTRKELAEDICSEKYIYNIEKGLCTPTSYYIQAFSEKLNTDIIDYFSDLQKHYTFEIHDLIIQINELLGTGSFSKLKDLIYVCETIQNFHKGEPYQILLYAKCLCYLYLDSNYQEALTCCLAGLGIDKNHIFHFIKEHKYISNVEYTLLNCLSSCIELSEDLQLSIKIRQSIYQQLEHVTFSPAYDISHNYFILNYLSSLCHSLSISLTKAKDYKLAMSYADQGIKICTKTHLSGKLYILLKSKLSIYYKLQDYDNAKIYFNYANTVLNIYENKENLQNFCKEIKTEYPNVLG